MFRRQKYTSCTKHYWTLAPSYASCDCDDDKTTEFIFQNPHPLDETKAAWELWYRASCTSAKPSITADELCKWVACEGRRLEGCDWYVP